MEDELAAASLAKEEEGLAPKEVVAMRRERIRNREVRVAKRQALHRLKEMFGAEFLFDQQGMPNKDNLLSLSKGKYLRSLKMSSLKLA